MIIQTERDYVLHVKRNIELLNFILLNYRELFS